MLAMKAITALIIPKARGVARTYVPFHSPSPCNLGLMNVDRELLSQTVRLSTPSQALSHPKEPSPRPAPQLQAAQHPSPSPLAPPLQPPLRPLARRSPATPHQSPNLLKRKFRMGRSRRPLRLSNSRVQRTSWCLVLCQRWLLLLVRYWLCEWRPREWNRTRLQLV